MKRLQFSFFELAFCNNEPKVRCQPYHNHCRHFVSLSPASRALDRSRSANEVILRRDHLDSQIHNKAFVGKIKPYATTTNISAL